MCPVFSAMYLVLHKLIIHTLLHNNTPKYYFVCVDGFGVRVTNMSDSLSPATVVWTFNGGQVPANSQLEAPEPGTRALQLSRVTQEENEGVYACLAHLGGSSTAAATLQLEIYGGARSK